MSANQQDVNIIVQSNDQRLNSCEFMVQSRVQSRVQSPGFVYPVYTYILFILSSLKFVILTYGGENGINGSRFPVFSEDLAFAHAHRFVATRSPPSSHPLVMLVVFAMSLKNYLKTI